MTLQHYDTREYDIRVSDIKGECNIRVREFKGECDIRVSVT